MVESPQIYALVADESATGQRLDKWLSAQLADLSRARLQQLMAEGQVLIAGKPVKGSSLKLRGGERLEVHIPAARPMSLAAETIPLDIVFEDEHMLVINKAAGMAVHPAPGHSSGTLVHALLGHCGDSLSGIGGVERPGIVHRLDKDTSGLLVIAKHDKAHHSLQEQLQARIMKRHYVAVVRGAFMPRSGEIEGAIGRHPKDRKKMAVVTRGGKDARTHYDTRETYGMRPDGQPIASLIDCELDTGRTHQIRVHCQHAGHPLIGDPVYGRKHSFSALKSDADIMEILYNFARQALHAEALKLHHPINGEAHNFTAELPEDMQILIDALRILNARNV